MQHGGLSAQEGLPLGELGVPSGSMGLGPIIAGALSDYFAAPYGAAEGLRYSMMIVGAVMLRSGRLMLRTSAHLQQNAGARGEGQ